MERAILLEHPLAAEVAVGHVMLAMAEYDTQQQRLQQQLGEDVFVASFKALRTDRGRVYSYTTWSKDVPSVLPQADEVALVLSPGEKDTDIIRVPWRALVEVVGDCLVREPDADPPRWRTTRWPDDGAMAKLRASPVA